MCQLKMIAMKMYKVVFKTFDYWNADHVKQLIQKNDDLIMLIEEI